MKIYSIIILSICIISSAITILRSDEKANRISNAIAIIVNMPILVYILTN
jgi:hypothetical protein